LRLQHLQSWGWKVCCFEMLTRLISKVNDKPYIPSELTFRDLYKPQTMLHLGLSLGVPHDLAWSTLMSLM
jgi:hypothetical protein